MAELNKSGRVNVSNKFLYIEPNDSFGTDINSSVPLEKLCIYVDLVVEYQSRESIVMKSTNTETITMHYSVGGKGNEGSIIGNVDFLSTKGYGNYTFLDINNEGTSELFGIESINIAYNSFMVPEVNIQFVDIKGAALHGAEELAHNEDAMLDEEVSLNNEIKFLSCFFTVPYPRFRLIVKGFYGNPLSYDLMCAEFKSSFESKTGDYKATAKMVGYSFGLISDVSICSLMAAPYSSYYGKKYWEEQKKTGRFKFDNGADLLTMSEVVSTWYYRMGELGDIDTEAYNNDNSYAEKLQEVNESLTKCEMTRRSLMEYLTFLVDTFGENKKVVCGCKYYDESEMLVCVTIVPLADRMLFKLTDKAIILEKLKIKDDLLKQYETEAFKKVMVIQPDNLVINNPDIRIFEEERKRRMEVERQFLRDVAHEEVITVSEEEQDKFEDMDYDKDYGWKNADMHVERVEKYIETLKSIIGNNFYDWEKLQYFKLHEDDVKDYDDEKLKSNILSGLVTSDQKDCIEIIKSAKALNADYKVGVFVYSINLAKIIKKISTEEERLLLEIERYKNVEKERLNNKLLTILGFKPTIKNITKLLFAHLETFLYMYNCVEKSRENDNTYEFGYFPEYNLQLIERGVKKQIDGWIGSVYPLLDEVQMTRGLLGGVSSGIDEYPLPVGIQKSELQYYCVAPCDVIKGVNPFIECEDNKDDEVMKKRLFDLFVVGLTRYNVNARAMGQMDAQNYAIINPNGSDRIFKKIGMRYWSNSFFVRYTTTTEYEWATDWGELFIEHFTLLKNTQLLTENIVNDSSLEYFKIIDDGSLDGSQFLSNIRGASNQDGWQTIDTSGGWITKEEKSGFRFQWYINSLTAYIVPKVVDLNSMAKLPFRVINNDITEKKIVAPTNDYINYYRAMSGTTDDFTIVGEVLRTASEHDRYVDIWRDSTSDKLYEQLKDLNWDKYQGGFMSRTLRCLPHMDYFHYTILTIPGNNANSHRSSLKEGTLFCQQYYKDCKDIYLKAFYFLMSFTWGRDYNTDEDSTGWKEEIYKSESGYTEYRNGLSKDNYKNSNFNFERCMMYYRQSVVDGEDFRFIEVLPLFYVLRLGVLCYGKAQGWNAEKSGYFHGYSSKMNVHYLQEHYRNELSRYFTNWVNTYYKKWDYTFQLAEKDETVNQELYYLQYTPDTGNTFKFFKDSNQIVQEITKQFFKLIVWYKYSYCLSSSVSVTNAPFKNISSLVLKKTGIYTLVNEDFDGRYSDDFLSSCAKKDVLEYLQGFEEGLYSIFEPQVVERQINVLNISTSDDEMELTTYRYLCQLWDRWIINSYNKYDEWLVDKVINDEKGRIHFIDSSYNRIGDIVLIDIKKFVELIESCKEQGQLNLPFLTFLSYFYRDNHCTLHNIQNFYDTQDGDNVKKIFTPISFEEIDKSQIKYASDLIVMFSYQLAEGSRDSFNINDESYKLPERLQKYINGDFRVPAIGVTYGAQNQNYFIDINVSMNTPNVTDVSLQAHMQIADNVAQESATDSTLKMRSYGQDMWQVVGNHAYECSVKMMGCPWIQPLMYFQLMNVPLFRGAYIIQKVTHSIQAGNMTTTFTGQRISSKNMKVLTNMAVETMDKMRQQIQELEKYEKAYIINNCPYSYFDPYGVDDENDKKYRIEVLNFLTTNSDITIPYKKTENGEIVTSYETINEAQKIIMIFIKTAKDKVGDSYESVLLYLVILLHNYWKKWRDSYAEISDLFFDFLKRDYLYFFNDLTQENVSDYSFILENEEDKNNFDNYDTKLIEYLYYGSYVRHVSYEGGIGKDEYAAHGTIDGLVPYNDFLGEGLVEVEKCGADYVFVCGMYGEIITYFSALDGKSESDSLKIENLVDAMNKTLSATTRLKDLKLKIFEQYEDKEDKQKRFLLSLDGENDGIDGEIKSSVFDMVVQTYSHFFSIVSWVVNDKDKPDEMWEYIGLEIDGRGSSVPMIYVGYRTRTDIVNFRDLEVCDNLNLYFYITLMKKWNIKKVGSSNVFNTINKDFTWGSLNFLSIFGTKGDTTKVLDFFNTNDIVKNIVIEECIVDEVKSDIDDLNITYTQDNSDVKSVEELKIDNPNYQFDGAEGSTVTLLNQNQLINEVEKTKNLLMRHGFTPLSNDYSSTHGTDKMGNAMEALAQNTKSHIKKPEEKSGACAFYVRRAMERVLKFKTDGRPDSACQYVNNLSYWGFSKIYSGTKSGYKGTYLNGDIMVISGKELPERDGNGKLVNPVKTDDGRVVSGNRRYRHGHIQVYCDGLWYADKAFKQADCYGDERPCVLFRGITTESVIRSARGLYEDGQNVYYGNEFIYCKKNGGKNWTPSPSIKAKIKEFEGWHGGQDEDGNNKAGWALCPGNHLTTGWGFKQTDVLKKKYPNGMTEEQANKYFEEIVNKFAKELKRIMKDMMFYNNSQMDALFDLIYNIGLDGFENNSPKMMGALRSRNVNEVIIQMDHGLKDGLAGLVIRRNYERGLFKTNLGTTPPSNCT